MKNYAEYNENYNQNGQDYAMFFETLDRVKSVFESKKGQIHDELKIKSYAVENTTYNEPFLDNVRIYLERPVCASIQLTTDKCIKSLDHEIEKLPADPDEFDIESIFTTERETSLRQHLVNLRCQLDDYNEYSRSLYSFERHILGLHKSENEISESQKWNDDQNFSFDQSKLPDDSNLDDSIEESSRVGAN